MAKDFLDELIDKYSKEDPAFPKLVQEAYERRVLARELARQRRKRGLTQTQVAARMKTAASVISKIENGGDFKFSTLQKYLEVVGADLTYDVTAPDREKSRVA